MEEHTQRQDFTQQVTELYAKRPELRGEPLPEDVVKACVEGKPLSEAYTEYSEKQAQAQNEKSARHAPVRSVTAGGSAAMMPEDAFLRGFNEI